MPVNIDAKLSNADWPKRTNDKIPYGKPKPASKPPKKRP